MSKTSNTLTVVGFEVNGFLTVCDAAALTGIPRAVFNRAIANRKYRNHQIEPKKIGRTWVLHHNSIRTIKENYIPGHRGHVKGAILKKKRKYAKKAKPKKTEIGVEEL